MQTGDNFCAAGDCVDPIKLGNAVYFSHFLSRFFTLKLLLSLSLFCKCILDGWFCTNIVHLEDDKIDSPLDDSLNLGGTLGDFVEIKI